LPLAFQTVNHGTVAFGFFNIESDMLLLEQYFFFAEDFCRFISECARQPEWSPTAGLEAFVIDDPKDIGDLMGAINGVRHTGFIGETYRRFPFPARPDDFKQNPHGSRRQPVFREMITPYAKSLRLPFSLRPQQRVGIGEYVFELNWFYELLRYVEKGGMPGWKDGIRPGYVEYMAREINRSGNEIFSGLKFPTEG
jgi:hypothetical protein